MQATIALVALFCSPLAAAVALAIGLLAFVRYIAVVFFVSTMGKCAHQWPRFLATSAWSLGFIALLVALVAVAVKAKVVLPWAIAAAFAGPFGLSVLAFGSGLSALAVDRGSIKAGRAGGGQS
jgi:uncharacterized protein YhhL (DUF1145 family)